MIDKSVINRPIPDVSDHQLIINWISGFITILSPFYHHFANITILSPFYHHFRLWTFYHHFITILSPSNHHLITILSPFYHHIITILSPFYHHSHYHHFITISHYHHFITILSPFYHHSTLSRILAVGELETHWIFSLLNTIRLGTALGQTQNSCLEAFPLAASLENNSILQNSVYFRHAKYIVFDQN